MLRMEASKRARAGIWWCVWLGVRTEGVQFGGQGAVEVVAMATGLAVVGVVAFAGMVSMGGVTTVKVLQFIIRAKEGLVGVVANGHGHYVFWFPTTFWRSFEEVGL